MWVRLRAGVQRYRQETEGFGDCESAQPAWAFGSVAVGDGEEGVGEHHHGDVPVPGSHFRTG